MLEENCFLNKRILELDLEVQSLETILSKLKKDLEQAEHKTSILGQSLKSSQDGYGIKCMHVNYLQSSSFSNFLTLLGIGKYSKCP